MSIEVWKPVVGYEGWYEVSNIGKVKSVKRKYKGEKILTPTKARGGYLKVILYREGRFKNKLIHRLVLEAFEGSSKLGVNHIDGDKHNNFVENLEWSTQKSNITHSVINGLKRSLKGEDNNSSNKYKIIFPDGTYRIVRGLAEFCRKGGLNRRAMNYVLKGTYSQHKGYRCEHIS